jgi:hypothetical protein
MKKVLSVVVVAAVGGAYLYGWWPQRERRLAAEARVASLERELAAAQSRVRLAELHGQLLGLIDVVSEKNYGQAQALSTRFFDAARAEAGRTSEAAHRAALEAILAMRDAVTAALTQGDPASLAQLHDAESRLRRALGYPLPAPAAPAPPSPPATPAP